MFPITAIAAVQFFFIISGFIISYVLAQGFYNDEVGRIKSFNFYRSRLLRLFPGYVIALCFALFNEVMGYTRVFENISTFDNSQRILSIVLNVSMYGLLDPTKGGRVESWIFVPPAWSLTPEIFFYILIPSIMRFAKNWQSVILFIGCFFSLYLEITGVYLVSDSYLPIARLGWFFLGCLAYRVYEARDEHLIEKWGAKVLWVALPFATFCCYFFHLNTSSPLNIYSTWIVVMCFLVIIPLLHHKLRDSSFDRNLGMLSYPVYIMHDPIITSIKNLIYKDILNENGKHVSLSHAILIYFVIFLVAYMSVTCVEKPINRFRWKKFRR